MQEVLEQERLTASVNYQRLMCLLRTVHGAAPAKQQPQMNVSRLLNRLLGREELDLQRNAPMDTPHRHMATAMQEMQETVTFLEKLNLSHEHTAIMNVTEVTRQNLLAVVQDVRDFVVRRCAVLTLREIPLIAETTGCRPKSAGLTCFALVLAVRILGARIFCRVSRVTHERFPLICVQELPNEMHDMIRGMTYDPQALDAYPCVASSVVAHMLRVAPSCAVSAALVHMAQHKRVCALARAHCISTLQVAPMALAAACRADACTYIHAHANFWYSAGGTCDQAWRFTCRWHRSPSPRRTWRISGWCGAASSPIYATFLTTPGCWRRSRRRWLWTPCAPPAFSTQCSMCVLARSECSNCCYSRLITADGCSHACA